MKEKLLNFLIIFLLTFLIVNFFSNKNKQTDLTSQGVIKLEVLDSYTVPVSLKINIKNYTSTGFTFDTCKDLSIKKDSKIILYNNCELKTIKSGETLVLNYSKLYKNFSDIGEYFILLKANGNDVISKFEVEHRGFIGKFFIFFFYSPIYNLMAFLLEFTGYSLGWSIVIVTIIIRLLLLLPQHKMMVSQKKMQIIQPKIKEIQEKHKGDYQNLGVELMKLYKQENVNPMGSLGLLFIQMPILLVIYNVIVGIQDYAKNYYLYSFLGDYKIESINSIFYGVDLFKIGGTNGLILAIIIGLLQFIQIKLSLSYNKVEAKKTQLVIEKKKDSNDYQSLMPDPEMINKFMLYGMPFMIGIATYTFFAGVGLYWGIGTIFMIGQQLFINKIIKK